MPLEKREGRLIGQGGKPIEFPWIKGGGDVSKEKGRKARRTHTVNYLEGCGSGPSDAAWEKGSLNKTAPGLAWPNEKKQTRRRGARATKGFRKGGAPIHVLNKGRFLRKESTAKGGGSGTGATGKEGRAQRGGPKLPNRIERVGPREAHS